MIREEYIGEEKVRSIAQAYYEEGIHEGILKGKLEGINEGAMRGKREIALNLLKQKAPLDLITSATGFSKKEIEKLKKLK